MTADDAALVDAVRVEELEQAAKMVEAQLEPSRFGSWRGPGVRRVGISGRGQDHQGRRSDRLGRPMTARALPDDAARFLAAASRSGATS